jgi:myo-inositol 2-dehydrogenase/D-chiro-inositol 1-dehydrogenase
VIGAGTMGADHANTRHRFVSGAEAALVTDVNWARAAAVTGAIPGARATDQPVAPIAGLGVDAVVLCPAGARVR